MNIRIMMLGDAVGVEGSEYLLSGGRLRREAASHKVDFIIVNGENSAADNGITPISAETLLSAGADVITGGNHTLRRRSVYSMLDDVPALLRPANLPSADPGEGARVFEVCGFRLLVINLLGQIFINSCASSPFTALDRILESFNGAYDAAIVDLHAEATSEKLSFARYADSRLSIIAGTHTHVATADVSILPGGCGYITDLGMCGSHAGVLGVSSESALHRYISGTGMKFVPAEGSCAAHGAVFELDMSSGRCVDARSIHF